MQKLSILFVLFFSFYVITKAQSPRFYYFSLGIQGGTTHYQGDLDDNGFEVWRDNGSNAFAQRLFRPALGLQFNFHFNPYMYARLALNHGWIAASDSLNREFARNYRNLHFRSPITELSLQLVVEPFAKNDYYRFRKEWDPYFFFGIAIFRFNPKAKPDQYWSETNFNAFPIQNTWVELQPLGTEGQNLPKEIREGYGIPEPYKRVQFAIPFGIGIRRKINRYVDLRIDISVRKTFTDYLDDVSGYKYPNPNALLGAEKGEKAFYFSDRSGYANFGYGRTPNPDSKYFNGAYPYNGYYENGKFYGERRGDEKDNDWYGFINVGITRILK